MIKFIIVIIFMNFIVIYNNIIIFYYNLCCLSVFLIIFIFIYKDIEWFNIIIRLEYNYYSIILVIKILDFGFNMCLNESSRIKILIFINVLVVLIIFFIFIDLISFYLIFEIRLIPTFF